MKLKHAFVIWILSVIFMWFLVSTLVWISSAGVVTLIESLSLIKSHVMGFIALYCWFPSVPIFDYLDKKKEL